MKDNQEIEKLEKLLKRKGITNSVKKSIQERLKILTDDKVVVK